MNTTVSALPEGRHTASVCPVCLRRVPAVLREEKGEWRIFKQCAEHGLFSAVVWRDAPQREGWAGGVPETDPGDNPACPTACGLCPSHKQGTCCVLLEITSRCNLACRFCFAEAEKSAPREPDPSLDEVTSWIADIAGAGKAFLQLSGGEPSLRDDLPEIVRRAKALGCEYVQLNSNGLRLAEDEAFTKALAEAGLSFVFMQFDGLDDGVYTALRGKPLLDLKLRAIEACGRHNIGVTLVPTVVPGVNDAQIGDIIRFAVERSPLVRGVHFQPVSYFGRYPHAEAGPDDSQRITLPEVYSAVFAQAGDLVPEGSIVPSRCDHPACGFHGGYIATPGGGLKALTPAQQPDCCSSSSAAERNRRFVGSRWLRPSPSPQKNCCEPLPLQGGFCCETLPMQKTSCCESAASAEDTATPCDLNTLDGFLQRARSHSFTISAMAFQDAYTLDLERLRQCSLHVYDHGRIVPFCSYYIMG